MKNSKLSKQIITKTFLIDVLNYLKNSSLKDEYVIDNDLDITFHWANWKESLNFEQVKIEQDEAYQKKLNDLILDLDQYKKNKVWVRDDLQLISFTLFDLYQFYLDPRLKMYLKSSKKKLLVSQTEQSGPYVTFLSLRWLEKEIYEKFMRQKILVHKNYPARGLRLGINLELKASSHNQPLTSRIVCIHQFSSYGVTLKFSDRFSIQAFTDSSSFSLIFDPSDIKKLVKRFGGNLNFDFKLDPKILNENGNKHNISNQLDGKIYIFCPYKDMLFENNDKNNISESLQKLILDFEEVLSLEIKNELKPKKLAA